MKKMEKLENATLVSISIVGILCPLLALLGIAINSMNLFGFSVVILPVLTLFVHLAYIAYYDLI
jgi:hypothetical protein